MEEVDVLVWYKIVFSKFICHGRSPWVLSKQMSNTYTTFKTNIRSMVCNKTLDCIIF